MSDKMGFLWAVTAVVWLGTLAYVAILVRKQARLERELDALEHALKQVQP